MELLKNKLDTTLTSFKFKEKPLQMIGPEFGAMYGWKRQSWNSNYGIALIELRKLPQKLDAAYTRRLAMVAGKALGYKTFFNPIGVQLILVGNGVRERIFELHNIVDRVQTFTVILQNVFIVDTSEKLVEKSHTWGQFNARKHRNAISDCLDAYISELSAS